MSPRTTKFISVLLISGAIIGWLLVFASLVAIWGLRPRLTQAAVQQVAGLKASLELAIDGLRITHESLGAIAETMQSLEGGIDQAAQALDGATPFLNGLISVADQNLPGTLTGLRSSLEKAQAGAQRIDDALRKVTSLPLIGPLLTPDTYNPTTPLDQGLASLSQGLDRLDESFNSLSENLTATRDNLQDVQGEIEGISRRIGEIRANLQAAQGAIKQYQSAAQSALEFLNRWGDRLPQLIITLAIIFTILLLWIAITQLGLFLQGMQYYRSILSSSLSSLSNDQNQPIPPSEIGEINHENPS